MLGVLVTMNKASCLVALALVAHCIHGLAGTDEGHGYRSPFEQSFNELFKVPLECSLEVGRKDEVLELAKTVAEFALGRLVRKQALYNPPYRCGTDIGVTVNLIGDDIWQTEVWLLEFDTVHHTLSFRRIDGS